MGADAEFVIADRAAHGLGLCYSLSINAAPATITTPRAGTSGGARSAQGRPKVGGRSDHDLARLPHPGRPTTANEGLVLLENVN
jgi:hypothetical protein